MKTTIKIKFEKVPHYEGLALYVNNVKTHLGVFVSLKALREFWHKNQHMLCHGYIQQCLIWKKI